MMKQVVAIISTVGFASLFLISCGGASEEVPVAKTADVTVPKKPAIVPEEMMLKSIDHKVGTGEEATNGSTVEVHYTGWLYADGKRGEKFDSSVDRDEPFRFKLGARQVIKGWDEGVQGMKVGGKRELIIPSKLGYGSSGAGGVIPPNATLDFEVELLKVSK